MSRHLFLFLIILLLGICGPANEAVAPPPQDPNAELWAGINESSVEAACLDAARQEAGGYAWAVKGCDCNGTEREGLKEYDCRLSMLQGAIPAHITCILPERMCLLESAYGNGSATFDEIRQFEAG